jgi:N-acetylglutamate synthase-like GNAT family acetyltransferase
MIFRKASRQDVPAIVTLLANDSLGKWRENIPDPLPEQYYSAFQKIDGDPNQELIVVENDDGEVIGTMQLSYIQYLTYQGGMRMQIEGVRVRDDQRGKGMGEKIFTWAINRAKEKGAHLVQLTSDKRRTDAIRFYEKLGFVATHEGMKLHF